MYASRAGLPNSTAPEALSLPRCQVVSVLRGPNKPAATKKVRRGYKFSLAPSNNITGLQLLVNEKLAEIQKYCFF